MVTFSARFGPKKSRYGLFHISPIKVRSILPFKKIDEAPWPKRVKIYVKKFSTMVQLLVFMDTKFRDKDELVSGRLAYLRNYEHLMEAQSAVESIIQLEQPDTIKEFMYKLPNSCKVRYKKLRAKQMKSGKKLKNIVCNFLDSERIIRRQ